MYDRFARWIFDFRPQVLGVLAALTLYAAFNALRIAPAPAFPDYAPSDPTIRVTSAQYDRAFPAERALAFYVEATGRARLDSAEGEIWLGALDGLMAGLFDRNVGEAGHGVLAADIAPVHRVDPDGRAGVVKAALRPSADPDLHALPQYLAALDASGPFRALLLEPPPPSTALDNQFSRWAPELAGLALLAAGLLAYSASFVLTGLAIGAALLAIVWQTGVWALFGGAFDASQRFVAAFLVALVLGHAFPMARYVMRGLAAGASPIEAALSMVRRIAPAGAPGLIAVALALFAGAILPIAAARQTLLFAGLGVFFAVPALFIVMPLLMSQIRIDRPPAEAMPEQKRPPRRRSELSLRQAAAGPQTIALLALALGLVAALESHTRFLGPVDAAALSSSNDPGWIDTANAAAAAPGAERASVVVLARTTPETCTRFDVLDAVDRLSWQIANIPGVSAVESLPLTLRGFNAQDHGGDPRWRDLPREPVGALQAMVKVPRSAGLLDPQCRTLTIRAFASPPIADVLARIDGVVSRFGADNANSAVTFALAGGPLAGALSEQRLLERYQTGIIIAVITALVLVAFFGLGDWRAAGAMLLMGVALFLACGWAVAAIPLGLTGRTTPFILLALVLSADMGVYVVMGWRAADAVSRADPDLLRRRLWQRDGRALLARSLAMCLCFSVWLAARDPLQRQLGILAIVMTLVGMMTALFVIPAASMLIERGLERRRLAAG
jgi:predicted RND superfamily exporter protein